MRFAVWLRFGFFVGLRDPRYGRVRSPPPLLVLKTSKCHLPSNLDLSCLCKRWRITRQSLLGTRSHTILVAKNWMKPRLLDQERLPCLQACGVRTNPRWVSNRAFLERMTREAKVLWIRNDWIVLNYPDNGSCTGPFHFAACNRLGNAPKQAQQQFFYLLEWVVSVESAPVPHGSRWTNKKECRGKNNRKWNTKGINVNARLKASGTTVDTICLPWRTLPSSIGTPRSQSVVCVDYVFMNTKYSMLWYLRIMQGNN